MENNSRSCQYKGRHSNGRLEHKQKGAEESTNRYSKVIASKDQVVPGAGMSTGLGSSSPFGVGGYEMVNHPQYMSAISSAVDPDKM